MRAFRITDFMVVAVIMQDKKIYADSFEDNHKFEIPDLVDEMWGGVEENGTLIGCYRFHQMSSVLWQIHAAVIPEHRKKHSMKASKLALRWAGTNIPGLETIVCYIPEKFKNVEKHVLEIGFDHLGKIPGAWMKDGKLMCQNIYGISKEKVIKF